MDFMERGDLIILAVESTFDETKGQRLRSAAGACQLDRPSRLGGGVEGVHRLEDVVRHVTVRPVGST